jgi:hypoxanthine phosphoribosyltransferase
MDVSDIEGDLSSILYTEEQIHAKIAEVARLVERDYAGRDPLLVGVLKGAVMVMADFARELRIPATMDWMAVSSYGSGTKSSGVVRILKDLDSDLHGRDVIIVEDIIDSGLTLSWLLGNLRGRGAASVEIFALLRKPEAATVEVDVKYAGFEIPNEFVVGYGLDYDERYRNLRAIGILAPHVYS